jgi:hypothetical protein
MQLTDALHQLSCLRNKSPLVNSVDVNRLYRAKLMGKYMACIIAQGSCVDATDTHGMIVAVHQLALLTLQFDLWYGICMNAVITGLSPSVLKAMRIEVYYLTTMLTATTVADGSTVIGISSPCMATRDRLPTALGRMPPNQRYIEKCVRLADKLVRRSLLAYLTRPINNKQIFPVAGLDRLRACCVSNGYDAYEKNKQKCIHRDSPYNSKWSDAIWDECIYDIDMIRSANSLSKNRRLQIAMLDAQHRLFIRLEFLTCIQSIVSDVIQLYREHQQTCSKRTVIGAIHSMLEPA